MKRIIWTSAWVNLVVNIVEILSFGYYTPQWYPQYLNWLRKRLLIRATKLLPKKPCIPLLSSALITPDGTRLKSLYRHDYQTHDDANGKMYMLDGGMDYVRSSANGDEVYETIYYQPDNHEHNRKHMRWGTRGKDGDQPTKYVRVRDLSNSHIEEILKTQKRLAPHYQKTFNRELIRRHNETEKT